MIEQTKNNSEKTSTKKIVDSFKKGGQLSIGALNGVVGDYLNNQNNGLSVKMDFYANNKPIILSSENIKAIHPKPSSKICILIHGLTNDETIWDFPKERNKNYGTLLQNDLNYTPFFVRYNTGLHISENGKQLSQLITSLSENYPTQISEIVIIGHSMGGLVARSACYYAPLQGSDWTTILNKIFYLGSPHLGAPLEKFGNALSHLLNNIPNQYTKLASSVINLRSAGIKDLRYGYIRDEDWQDEHPDTLLKNSKKTVPLLENTDHYLITGTITDNPKHLISEWFGDALVRHTSGTGQSKSEHHLPFDLKNHKEYAGLVHLSLAYSPEIYTQIKEWVSEKNKNFNPEAHKLIPVSERKEVFFYTETSQKSNVNGSIKLALDTISSGISAISNLRKGNRRTTYRILAQIPIVSLLSNEIEQIQNNISDTTISTIKKVLPKQK